MASHCVPRGDSFPWRGNGCVTALQVALGISLALALALAMLMAAGPASAESIPQNPLIEDILKINDIKLVRRDDRTGVGNLVVKHPPHVKAEKGEPNYEGWGTAWMIGECHIMTARHVIDPSDPDVETNDLPMKSSIQFVIGPVRDQTKVEKTTNISKLPQILDSSKAIPVAWGQYQFPKPDDPAGKHKAEWENFYEDWALLKLEKCLGAGSKGYIPLAVEGITTDTMMKRTEPLPARGLSGPPVSGISHLVDDDKCHLYGQVEWALWNSDCFARPGSSGSPILTPDGNGGWKVVAILTRGPVGGSIRNELLEGAHPKGWPWRVQHMQLGNPVSGFLDRIRPLLADDKKVRLSGAGTNKPYAEKDEGMVKELAKKFAAQPDDMSLAVRWLIALHKTHGAEAALTEIDKLLALHPDFARTAQRAHRHRLLGQPPVQRRLATGGRRPGGVPQDLPGNERAAEHPGLHADAGRRVQERREPAPQVMGPARRRRRRSAWTGRMRWPARASIAPRCRPMTRC